MEGWIKLHRSILEHPIWNNAEHLRAWVYLIFAAAYEPRQVTVGNAVYTLQRGEIVTTMSLLSYQIKLTKNQTHYLLEKLKATQMITTESSPVCTRIRICNYDKYQDILNADQTRSQQYATNPQTLTKRGANDTQPMSQRILKKEEERNKEETFGDSYESSFASGNEASVPNDVKEIFDYFNTVMEGKAIPQIRCVQGARLRILRARLKTNGMDDVKEVFRNAADSDFLQGSTGLRVTFDWLIKQDHFQKVLEGNYNNRYGKNDNAAAHDGGQNSRNAEIDRLDADFKARSSRRG